MLLTHLPRLACEGLNQKIAEHWPWTKQRHCYVAEHFLKPQRIKVTLYQYTESTDLTFHCCICGGAELFSASSCLYTILHQLTCHIQIQIQF
jgi:hypothetical protein